MVFLQSISDGEAAVAAPFSGRTVTAVDTLLREVFAFLFAWFCCVHLLFFPQGRGALATSFALFKFMIMYSVIQTTSVMICYVFLNLLADLQFLWLRFLLVSHLF